MDGGANISTGKKNLSFGDWVTPLTISIFCLLITFSSARHYYVLQCVEIISELGCKILININFIKYFINPCLHTYHSPNTATPNRVE